jgi:hypothetical protein
LFGLCLLPIFLTLSTKNMFTGPYMSEFRTNTTTAASLPTEL